MNSLRRSLFLLCLSCLALLPRAQHSAEVDSLLTLLGNAGGDSLRCELHLKVSKASRHSNTPFSITHAQDALTLAEKRGYRSLAAEAHMNIGMGLDIQGEYLQEHEHYLEGLAIFESLNDSVGIADLQNAIGNLFYNMNNFTKSMEYHRQAYRIRKRLNRKRMIASSLNNMGISQMELGYLDSAMANFRLARALNREETNPQWEASNLQNIGHVFMLQAEYDSAMPYFQFALHFRDSLGIKSGIITSSLAIGELLSRQDRHREAIPYHERAFALSEELGSDRYLRQAVRGLAHSHYYLGDMPKAARLFHQYVALDDSVEGNKLQWSITSKLFDKEKESLQQVQEAATENLRLQNEARLARQRMFIWLSLAGLLVASLLIGLLLQTGKSRRRMNLLLEQRVKERTDSLVRVNAELDKFIYQSSHDLRSPITSIRGLADIALSPAGKDDPARYLALIKDRAEHMDGVYSNLIITMNIRDRVVKPQAVHLPQMLEELMEEVRKTRPGKVLHLRPNLDVQSLRTDPMLLHQVMRSIAINAIDFCAQGAEAELWVASREVADGVEVRFQDQGMGIAAEALPRIFDMFFRGSNHSKGSGLGLYNARLASEKMGASLQAESTLGNGAIFTLFCPQALPIDP